MYVSQKCQYALQALVELALRYGEDATPAGEIAAQREIPARFLDLILGQLRQAGLVSSRRGAQGGYRLARQPRRITAGEVIRCIDGPVELPSEGAGAALAPMWRRAAEALAAVYDATTLADLADAERRAGRRFVPDYVI